MGCYRTIAAATRATDESCSSSVLLLTVDCSGETHVFDECSRRGELQVLVATASRCVINTPDVRVQPNTIATKHLNTPQQFAVTVISRPETDRCHRSTRWHVLQCDSDYSYPVHLRRCSKVPTGSWRALHSRFRTLLMDKSSVSSVHMPAPHAHYLKVPRADNASQ
jgi:hypothetical protein